MYDQYFNKKYPEISNFRPRNGKISHRPGSKLRGATNDESVWYKNMINITENGG